MLKFRGEQFKCGDLHSHPMQSMPDPDIQQTRFAGVGGESIIAGLPGGRDISVRVWLHDDAWTAANCHLLDEYVTEFSQLNTWQHRHGTLESTGGHDSTITKKQCTFLGFEASEQGPLLDETGMMGGRDNDDDVIPVWWLEGVLRFRQSLVVK